MEKNASGLERSDGMNNKKIGWKEFLKDWYNPTKYKKETLIYILLIFGLFFLFDFFDLWKYFQFLGFWGSRSIPILIALVYCFVAIYYKKKKR